MTFTIDTSAALGNDHLNASLAWLHRLLAWQIGVTRHTFGALADDEYRGLYISDAEADLLSSDYAPIPTELAERRAELSRDRAALDARVGDAQTAPLLRLGRMFGLSPFERDLLLLALAPEIDLRFERLYAYVQDDVTRKRPSVDLALRMLCAEPRDRIAARASLGPDAPLVRERLIQLFEDGQRQPTLLSRFIKIDERIVTELLGTPALDPLVLPALHFAHPERRLAELTLPEDLTSQLCQLPAHRKQGLVLALQGSYGSGRRAIAEALCAEVGLPLLTVTLDRLVEQEAAVSSPAEAIQRIQREAQLRGAAVLYIGADRLLHDETFAVWRQALLASLDTYQSLCFLPLDAPWEPRGLLRRITFLRIELPTPSFSEREQLWLQRLNGDSPGLAMLQALASTFRLSAGQIRDAATQARALARWRSAADGQPRLLDQDLFAACRAQSSGRLSNLAHKIKATYTWSDIVLPSDQVSQLREICIQVRHRRTVLESWGFDRHLAMGKGVNVLFAGQSGTGKTMAAEIIAADLGLELYKVDLSTMVSKYIGETEKNLDKVFTAAREANAILFFDEADALFGKRSEVKDAHDRYANIEVGYLLQKMEEYDGIVILATNLRKNLDDAFIRRLHVAIDFPFPEEPDRLRIWRKVFPEAAPLAEGVDLEVLAKQFKVAGGNIRNIALLAAYLAAEEGHVIEMTHIVRALKREYQKLGKLITEAEFGRYLVNARP